MAFTYSKLNKAARDKVRADLATPDTEPDYEGFLTAWEEAHVAHRALRDAAVADGDEEEAARHNEAIATLEESITNVRLGKRPDGTDKPAKPVDPEPVEPVAPAEPQPAPVAPDEPAPVEPDKKVV